VFSTKVVRAAAAATAGLGLLAPVAFGAGQSMTTHLGAQLSGMGEHGNVNLTSNSDKGTLCWTFELPSSAKATAASVRSGSVVVVRLGSSYKAKGCTTAEKMTLEHLATAPKKYAVWVDTPGHPGDLRGKLFAGMAHM
jgi:hypothetical protein